MKVAVICQVAFNSSNCDNTFYSPYKYRMTLLCPLTLTDSNNNIYFMKHTALIVTYTGSGRYQTVQIRKVSQYRDGNPRGDKCSVLPSRSLIAFF